MQIKKYIIYYYQEGLDFIEIYTAYATKESKAVNRFHELFGKQYVFVRIEEIKERRISLNS